VALSLALLQRFGGLIALFAAFSAASFLQANSGANRAQRQMVMSVTGIATALLVFAGALCHGHRVAAEVMLIAAASACFYARRFVPDRNLFTLYSFTLCLLATTFSGPWPNPLWIALAVLSGLPIAFVVFFYIWPPVFHLRFAAAVRTFALLVAHCLEAVNAGLEQGGHERRIARRVARLRAAMAACASLVASLKGSSVGKAAEVVVRLMRRIVVCFELLQESLPAIGAPQRSDLAEAIAETGAVFRALCAAYSNLDQVTSEPLTAESVRSPVLTVFERLPDHERDKHAAAALIEAGILAMRLRELGSGMASALRDPGFREE
jgi:hypothetical protein